MCRFFKKLKIELPYDLAIALLGVYPKDTDVVKRRTICTPMFVAAMSTIVKMWKESRCPSIKKWIKKMGSICIMEYYSTIRKDEYPTFASAWMGVEGLMLSEISQIEKVNYHMTSLICGI